MGTYGWNAENEMKSAAGVNYTYDGDGNRLEKSNGKLYWYGAGTEILDESDLSGNFSNEYVFFGGKRIAIRNISTGTIYYYAEDMLGSSRTIVQAGGTSACYDADFLPFGKELTVTNTCPQNYKFEGKERDTETTNDDFGARYYAFRFGRWLSADWSSVPAPVPYANLTNPQTLNLYAMVSDNPESFADLDGHCPGDNPSCDQSGQSNQNALPCTSTSQNTQCTSNNNPGTSAALTSSTQSEVNTMSDQTLTERTVVTGSSGDKPIEFDVGGVKGKLSWITYEDQQVDESGTVVNVEGRGMQVTWTPDDCSNCAWAQTVSANGGAPKADTQPGADPQKYPYAAATEHPGELYDRPSSPGAPASKTFVSTLGISSGKSFQAKGSIKWAIPWTPMAT